MNDLWAIAWGGGLHDGLNPCIFMTCSVLIACGLSSPFGFLRLFWLRVFFVLVYASTTLNFNYGPGQILTLGKDFIFTAKIIYFFLSVGTFILGVIFFREWILIRRGLPIAGISDGEKKGFKGYHFFSFLLTAVLAAVLSALATLWPVNNYIMLLGNELILRGQWQTAMPLLWGYTLIGMWPLLFGWAFISIKDLRPSMLKIVCASIFFTSSSVIILIFK